MSWLFKKFRNIFNKKYDFDSFGDEYGVLNRKAMQNFLGDLRRKVLGQTGRNRLTISELRHLHRLAITRWDNLSESSKQKYRQQAINADAAQRAREAEESGNPSGSSRGRQRRPRGHRRNRSQSAMSEVTGMPDNPNGFAYQYETIEPGCSMQVDHMPTDNYPRTGRKKTSRSESRKRRPRAQSMTAQATSSGDRPKTRSRSRTKPRSQKRPRSHGRMQPSEPDNSSDHDMHPAMQTRSRRRKQDICHSGDQSPSSSRSRKNHLHNGGADRIESSPPAKKQRFNMERQSPMYKEPPFQFINTKIIDLNFQQVPNLLPIAKRTDVDLSLDL